MSTLPLNANFPKLTHKRLLPSQQATGILRLRTKKIKQKEQFIYLPVQSRQQRKMLHNYTSLKKYKVFDSEKMV